MSVKDAIVAVLAEGPAQGRTMLQKKVYFLSVLADESFGFRPHYFGPYSPTVSASLSALVEANFVEESRVGYGVGSQFGEMSRFDYKLSRSGREVVKRNSDIRRRYRQHLREIKRSGVASDISTISIAAKVHFIVANQGETTIAQVKGEAQSLGWGITEKGVRRVVSYLQKLGLVVSK